MLEEIVMLLKQPILYFYALLWKW